MLTIEQQANEILAAAGAFRPDPLTGRPSVYREQELIDDYYRHVSDTLTEAIENYISEAIPEPARKRLASVLSAKQKQVIKLMDKHGMNQAAVAREMGMSRVAVCKLLRRAEHSIWDLLFKAKECRKETELLAEWAWRDEQALKHRLIYRHCTHPLKVTKYAVSTIIVKTRIPDQKVNI